MLCWFWDKYSNKASGNYGLFGPLPLRRPLTYTTVPPTKQRNITEAKGMRYSPNGVASSSSGSINPGADNDESSIHHHNPPVHRERPVALTYTPIRLSNAQKQPKSLLHHLPTRRTSHASQIAGSGPGPCRSRGHRSHHSHWLQLAYVDYIFCTTMAFWV